MLPRVIRSLVLALVLTGLSASSAHAASLSISSQPDVFEDAGTSIYASGAIDGGQSLYVRVLAGDVSCPSTAAAAGGTAVITSTYFSNTSFSTSGLFYPTEPGAYTACGYVASGMSAAATATDRHVLSVRRTTATMTLGVSADPTEDKAITITATGAMEVGRTVYARVLDGDAACPSTAAEAGGTSVISSTHFSPRSYTETGITYPTDAKTYTVCGYVAASTSAPADGTTRRTFTTRRTTATVTLGVAPGAMEGKGSTVTAAGRMEVGRTVYVRAIAGDVSCPDTAAGAGGISVISSTYFSPTTYNDTGTVYPSTSGPLTLCGYVAASTGASADAAVRISFPVAVDPAKPARPVAGVTDDGPDAPGLSAPLLLSPVDAIRDEQLNPTFRWSLDPVQGARYDRLRLQRIERDGSTTKLVDITRSSAISYLDVDGQTDAEGTKLDLPDVARSTSDATSISVTLKTALSPGDYSWFVLRSRPGEYSDEPDDQVTSASRRFTVLGPRLTRLTARLTSTAGRTSANPGYSIIAVKATPFVRVRYDIRRQGRSTALYSRADKNGNSGLSIDWSCRKPGGLYRIGIVASDQHGTRRNTTVSFAPVSKARCAKLRRAEARARRIRARKQAARQRAADRRHARRQAAIERAAREEQARRLGRFRRNCRAIGGSPTVIETDDGPYTVCRSPAGGTLPVPGMG